MSYRPHKHSARDAEAGELADNLRRSDIKSALGAYDETDTSHDIPYLGGSNRSGTTLFADRRFVAAVESGKFMLDGKPFDPLPYLCVHEMIEGALIRVLGLDYAKAHRQATIAEKREVEKAGYSWAKYEAAFRPFIVKTEAEHRGNFPPDLLLTPYEGTSLMAKLTETKKASKQEAHYREGTDSKHCAICTMFRPPQSCTSVNGSISRNALCDYFERKPMAKLTTAARKKIPTKDFAGPDRSYPIEDRAHAANAKARATQALNAGRISEAQHAKIVAKANRKLGK